MPEYKAICCDVDGTLLTGDKRITATCKEWIHKVVKEKGVRFVIVSGRMLYGVRKFYNELGIAGPASCCNGTCLFDEYDNLIQDYRVDGKFLKTIVQAARKNNLDLVYIVGNDWYMENRDNYTYRTKINFYYKDCILVNFDNLIDEVQPNKMVVMDTDPIVLQQFEKEVRSAGISDEDIFFYRGKNFIELMPGYADKSLALDAISKAYGIPIEQIIAIGDDRNDVKMIKKAGLGVAMGNAVEEAKKAADLITTSNEDDGVAAMIKKVFFN